MVEYMTAFIDPFICIRICVLDNQRVVSNGDVTTVSSLQSNTEVTCSNFNMSYDTVVNEVSCYLITFTLNTALLWTVLF